MKNAAPINHTTGVDLLVLAMDVMIGIILDASMNAKKDASVIAVTIELNGENVFLVKNVQEDIQPIQIIPQIVHAINAMENMNIT